MIDPAKLLAAYQTARDDLLAARTSDGPWRGELSGSALSTATAISALALTQRHHPAGRTGDRFDRLIQPGLDYLANSQNPDGGFGDTDRSLSNIAATLLVIAAIHLADQQHDHRELLERANAYVDRLGRLDALRRRYGRDKTFAAPILANLALAGLGPWKEVPELPFEMACFPQSLYRFLRLPVVSYAIPALVAVGQARYAHAPPSNPIPRWCRKMAVARSLVVLDRMQPTSGGYLEATPLTSFVVMCLAGIGRAEHPVVERGIAFLEASARPDGSWPIDTDLATWLTSLSLVALETTDEAPVGLDVLDWLLDCQHVNRHAFTGSDPGGWGWTDWSGAVPDVDDTSAALLALATLRPHTSDASGQRIDEAAQRGLAWLGRLQNRDGGWPTFCRGWGKLPFDRSGADLTAHALRALTAWTSIGGTSLRNEGRGKLPQPPTPPNHSSISRGLRYLESIQSDDGSFLPLWFGNQYHPDDENPVYGTARVLIAYGDLGLAEEAPARRGIAYLLQSQQSNGSWGGCERQAGGLVTQVSSVEETAVAVEALLACGEGPSEQPGTERGLAWLIEAVEQRQHHRAEAIGFYFAKLWYYEMLYPRIFVVSALGRAVREKP